MDVLETLNKEIEDVMEAITHQNPESDEHKKMTNELQSLIKARNDILAAEREQEKHQKDLEVRDHEMVLKAKEVDNWAAKAEEDRVLQRKASKMELFGNIAKAVIPALIGGAVAFGQLYLIRKDEDDGKCWPQSQKGFLHKPKI